MKTGIPDVEINMYSTPSIHDIRQLHEDLVDSFPQLVTLMDSLLFGGQVAENQFETGWCYI